MKKFLIGIIFLIPIIIVLAITATGRIIALTHPVNASRIELRNSLNEVIEQNVNDIFYIDGNDDSQYLIIDLYPSITDQKIIYEINRDLPGAGDLKLERKEGTNHYRLVPVYDEYGLLKSGVVQITIYAANNISVSRTVTVVVKAEVIKEIKVYDTEGGTVEAVELYAPARLYCDINPMDALVYETLRWTSGDPQILEVSPNGFVTPLKRGVAAVTVTATDKKGNAHRKSVTVDARKALLKASTIKSASELSLDWIKSNIVLSPMASVESLGGGEYIVSEGGVSLPLKVTACAAGEGVFEESLAVMYTNNGPYYIGFAYADITQRGQALEAEFSVSDGSVLEYRPEAGMIVPLKAGTAEITANYGGKTTVMQVTVKERPYAFNLMFGESDAKKGVQRSRIWGLNWLTPDRQYINTFQFGSSLAAGSADLRWETDNEEYAKIDQDALITFNPEAAGKSVKVRATVLVNNYATPIYREFTFNLAPDTQSVNVYNYGELAYVADTSQNDIVIQNDIKLERLNTHFANSIYGNGFHIDATHFETLNDDGIFRFESGRLTDPTKKIVFNDLWIEAAESYEQSKDRGSVFIITDMANPVEFKYSVIQFCNTGIKLKKVKNVLIEGCILGYSATTAIDIKKDNQPDYFFTIKNTVIKQCGGPGILLAIYRFDPEDFDKNYMPRFTVEGFLDITNWKTTKEMTSLVTGLDKSVFSGIASFVDPDNLMALLAERLEELFTSPSMSHLLYTNASDGQQYICAGVFVLGMYTKPDKNFFTLEDPALTVLPVAWPNDRSSLGLIARGIDALTMRYLNMTIFHPNYLLSYDFSGGKEPRYKPGDSIPQDFALYDRLVNGDQKKQIKANNENK